MSDTAVNNTSSLSALLQNIDMGPCNSIQFAYAKLQLAQSMLCKNKAESKLKDIENKQAEQKAVADMISRARALKQRCENKDYDQGTGTFMPEDMVQFFKDHDLAYDHLGDDDLHNKDEWAYNLQSLTNYQESISNSTQTDMVLLQDFISQYNSYLQGASAQVSQGGQTLTTLARGN
ncbi:MAG: hypothetical protein HUK26_04085 [Duodenibacillus sp.]|mgnify:FL=1|nr:hypothetical protein [Duodenibacillus sp.]